MYHVLLPVDANENRANQAVDTLLGMPISPGDLQVTILNVQEKIRVPESDGGHVTSDEWYEPENYPNSAKHAKNRLEDNAITVELRREHADPATRIVEVANEIEADQIIMTGRKRTAVGKVLFGSVMQSVLLNTELPVTVTLSEPR